MTIITRERLEYLQKYPEGASKLEAIELARIALASLDAEPIGITDRSEIECLKRGEMANVMPPDYKGVDKGDEVYVYAAQPAPVVPEEATPDNIEILASTYAPLGITHQWDGDGCNVATIAWNACRDAMLQGKADDEVGSWNNHKNTPTAEPVSQTYKLPFEQWLSQQNGKIDVDCGCVTTEAFFHWLRVAYEAGNSPVAPDGWVMVPTEPTEEMLRASWREAAVYSHTAYRAMIAAAPYFREIGKSSTKHFRENAETSTNG